MRDFLSLIDDNDMLMITGILLFLFGGLSVAGGSLPLSFAFVFTLGGLLMFTGAAFSLQRQVRFINSNAQIRRRP